MTSMKKTLAVAAVALIAVLPACSSGPSPEELCQEIAAGEPDREFGDLTNEAHYQEWRSKFESVNDESLGANGLVLLENSRKLEQAKARGADGWEQMAALDLDATMKAGFGLMTDCARHGVQIPTN